MSGHRLRTTADQLCPVFPGEIVHGLHVFRLGLGKRTERVQNIASIRRANIYQLLAILFDVFRSSNRENARGMLPRIQQRPRIISFALNMSVDSK